MTIDKKKIKHMFIRDKNKFPVGCLAYYMDVPPERARENREATIYYGVSTYNPVDVFDKGMASRVAAGRLMTRQAGFAISPSEHPNDVLADLCSLLHAKGEMPTRVHKCLREMRKRLLTAKDVKIK